MLVDRLDLDGCVTFAAHVDDLSLLTAPSTADMCVNPDRPTERHGRSTTNQMRECVAFGNAVARSI
jgi:hypothetical protein